MKKLYLDNLFTVLNKDKSGDLPLSHNYINKSLSSGNITIISDGVDSCQNMIRAQKIIKHDSKLQKRERKNCLRMSESKSTENTVVDLR